MAGLLVVLSSCVVIYHINERILEVNREKVLEVTRKGASILSNALENTEKSLHLFARMLPDNPQRWRPCIEELLKIYNFHRVALVTDDGLIVSNIATSQKQIEFLKNLPGEEDMFSKAYAGETGKLQTFFHFSFPLGGKQVTLYAERQLDKFYQAEAMEFFGDEGFSYVVSGLNGNFLLRSRNRNSQGLYADLFSMLLDSEKNSLENVQSLREMLLSGKTGTAVMQFRGEPCYLCFVPISDTSDWYFFSIIPHRSLEDVGRETTWFILCLVALALGSCFALYVLNRRSDILETKYQEQKFRDSLFNAISTNINTVIAVYNGQSRHAEFVSENIGRILGIDATDYARDPDMFLRRCLNGAIRGLFETAAESGMKDPASEESAYENMATGERLWIRVTVYPMRQQLSWNKYVFTLEDITGDRKKSELLVDAMKAAQRADEAKSSFLANMSHEIRTPMNAIIGMTVLAQMHRESPSRVEDCLKKIAGASRHLLGLINDILDMSQIASGKMTLSTETFSLSELLDATVSIILPQIHVKKHAFEARIDKGCDRQFVGDSLRIQQMLINILANAVKYTPENGDILLEVRAAPRGDGQCDLTFIVSDTGIGMSEEFQKIIFEPFSQEKAKQCQGTGIGMAITRTIVRLMGGTIDFTSKQGAGSTFTVRLSLPVAGGGESYDTRALTALRALIVDDDHVVGADAAVLLRELGMTADFAASGQEAVDKARDAFGGSEPLDVIILDWKMPGMDGLETARRIREIVNEDVPIIILSAYDWSAIEEDARRCGITAFISKPLFKSKLYHTLMSVVERQPAPKEERAERPFLGKRVLLAEDNALNAEIAVEILSLQGAEVDVAGNGEEAVALFENHAIGWYDLILMDVQMPVCDGYEATRRLRTLARRDAAEIPIIAMTANAFKEDEKKSLEAGMDGHLTKPIDVAQLSRTLQAFMGIR